MYRGKSNYWRCCMDGWTTRKVSEEAQKSFLEAERSILEQRRNGSLAQAIGEPLPGESPEELWWLVVEDQHLAEEGLVELRSGEEAWYKHLDELSLGPPVQDRGRERQEGLAHAAANRASQSHRAAAAMTLDALFTLELLLVVAVIAVMVTGAAYFTLRNRRIQRETGHRVGTADAPEGTTCDGAADGSIERAAPHQPPRREFYKSMGLESSEDMKLRLHSPHEYESELAGDSGALRDSGFVAAL